MQTTVSELVRLGPLPASSAPDVQRLERIQVLMDQVERPITDDEARELSTLFGPDECFGLAWTLLHIIETAPGWPLDDVLQASGNEWIERLKQRAANK